MAIVRDYFDNTIDLEVRIPIPFKSYIRLRRQPIGNSDMKVCFMYFQKYGIDRNDCYSSLGIFTHDSPYLNTECTVEGCFDSCGIYRIILIRKDGSQTIIDKNNKKFEINISNPVIKAEIE